MIRRNSKKEYESLNMLSPTIIKQDEGTDEYIRQLKLLIEHPDAKNVAISGPYGSGKSSIVKTYRSLYDKKENKSLIVSIGSFIKDESNKKRNNGKLDKIENNVVEKLEKSIIKEMVYLINYKNSRLSNIVKPQKNWKLKYGLYSTIIIYIILYILLYLIKFKPITILINNIINNKIFNNMDFLINHFHRNQDIYVFVTTLLFVIFCIYIIYDIINHILLIINNAKMKIRFKDNEVELNIMKKKDSFLFLDNLYEIIYAFFNTDYDTIFFEDIDRYGEDICIKVIEDLKELNLILNNNKDIGRKITFVYSFRDGIFEKKEQRTKFYDYIISVMPISTIFNSKVTFINELKAKELHEKISNELIGIVSKYITDMRMIKSTVNDYELFNKILDINKKDKIFAMVAYKNYYNKNYDELTNNENAIDKKLIDRKYNVEEEIDKKTRILDERIDKKGEKHRENVLELKKLLLYDNNYNNLTPTSIGIGGMTYNIETFLNNGFDIDTINDNCYFYYRNVGSKKIEYSSFESLENFKNQIHHFDKEILNLIQEKEDLENKKLDKEYIKIVSKEYLNNMDTKDLDDELIYLEYIENDYIDYITSISNNNQLSGNDSRFITKVNKKEYGFDMKLTHIDNVIEHIKSDLDSPYSLNADLIDFLIHNKSEYSDELNRVINQFKNIDINHISFLNITKINYLSVYYNLIKELSMYSEIIWNSYNKNYLSKDYRSINNEFILIDILMQKSIDNINIENISIIENDIIEYGNYKNLDFINNSNVKNNLKELKVKFKDINKVLPNFENKDRNTILDIIVNNNLFEINEENLKLIINSNYLDYPIIRNSKYGNKIIDYMKKNIDECADKLYIGKGNYINNKTAIVYIFGNSNNDKLIKEILKKEKFTLEKENDFILNRKYIKKAYNNNHIKVNWQFLYNYVSGNKIKDKTILQMAYNSKKYLINNIDITLLNSISYSFIEDFVIELYKGGYIDYAKKIIDSYYLEKNLEKTIKRINKTSKNSKDMK